MTPRLRSLCTSLLAVSVLGACSTFDDVTDWIGGEKEKTPLAGKRIAVLSESANLKSDEGLKDVPVTVPEVRANENWREAGGTSQGISGNLQASGFAHHDSTRAGDGNGWEQPLYSSPIVADGTVFVMDAKGYITAHDAAHIDKVKWTSKAIVSEDEADILGGGLAFSQGRLYVTSGRGKVYALDAATGKEVWKITIGMPLRAAPKVANGKVYVLSIDNQLFALDVQRGTQLWSHRGINENAGFLAAISPSVTDSIVIAPYSSGELHALDTASGQDIWSDTLLLAKRTTATAGFSGIGGIPIVKDDVVYAAGSSGFFAALSLTSGRRIWEQNVSSLNTPWITDDFVYVLSIEDELVCMLRADGRVKWTRQVPRYQDEKKHRDPLVWRGPILVNGQLLLAGAHGQMLALSPKDGSTLSTIEIPERITDAPVIAGGKLYMLTQNAKLHVLY